MPGVGRLPVGLAVQHRTDGQGLLPVLPRGGEVVEPQTQYGQLAQRHGHVGVGVAEHFPLDRKHLLDGRPGLGQSARTLELVRVVDEAVAGLEFLLLLGGQLRGVGRSRLADRD